MHRKTYGRHGCFRPRSSYGRTSHRFGGGHRARRGDTRAALLALLAERPMHGYEMIKELDERTAGAWVPSAGSVYPTLQLLEDEGLIEGEETEGRRRFSLTETGRKENESRTGDAPWEEVTAGSDPELLRLRRSAHQLLAALRQVAEASDSAERKLVRELLDDTRRKVYGILAESE
jgi:DNA-binding PadR family transcriptional regulator